MRELIFLATGAIIGGVITLLRSEKEELQQQLDHERRARQEAVQARGHETRHEGVHPAHRRHAGWNRGRQPAGQWPAGGPCRTARHDTHAPETIEHRLMGLISAAPLRQPPMAF